MRTQIGGERSYQPVLLGALFVVAATAAALWIGRGSSAPPPESTPARPAPTLSAEASRKPSGKWNGAPRKVEGAAAPEGPDTGEAEGPESPPQAAGEAAGSPSKEGIYAFPAPGTKRIRVGLVVPEDFQLPPGYVRHYQSTDKGEMLPAILMYSPFDPPKDEQGKPVEMPEDRIVPADRAPPDLPVQMLQVPANAYADPRDPGPLPDEAARAAGSGDSDP